MTLDPAPEELFAGQKPRGEQYAQLDRAISDGTVPAAERERILAQLEAVPEARRDRALVKLIESHRRARAYIENTSELIVAEEKNHVPREYPIAFEKLPARKKSYSERLGQKLLKWEHDGEKLLAALEAKSFIPTPRGTRDILARLFDRVIADCNAAKGVLGARKR